MKLDDEAAPPPPPEGGRGVPSPLEVSSLTGVMVPTEVPTLFPPRLPRRDRRPELGLMALLGALAKCAWAWEDDDVVRGGLRWPEEAR